MRKLLKYLKGYGKESVLGPLFKLLEASFELFVPLVVAAIIDTGIENGDKGYIVKMCLLLVALGVIGLVSAVTAQYFAAKTAVGFAKRLRHAVFEHIQSLSYTELDKVGTSTLITRLTSDVNQIQSGINLTLRLLLRSPLVVFGAMVMAFTIDVQAALVFVVLIPVLSVIVFGIILGCMPLYKKVQGALDKLLGITRENLKGVRVIRAFGAQESEIQKFTDANQTLTLAQRFVGKISALLNPVTYLVVNLAIIVLIWVGAIKVETGLLTQGMVIALWNYMSQILVELIKLANLIITITKALACARRVSAVLEITPSVTGAEGSPDKVETDVAVSFENITFRYGTSPEPSLEDIDVTVKRGQTVGIIGGTGSGKTSLVNLIPRFYD
ncbi:MAG: ABC transporter ATP-binding protein, partial [Clostridia bacterium]|nr:ABC transporter ATP-binding protein [Clostridia bacterium]